MKVETVKTVTEITLTLSLSEAEELRLALVKISGSRVAYELYSALFDLAGGRP